MAFVIPSFWYRHERASLQSAILHSAVVRIPGAACFFLSRRLWKVYRPVIIIE